MVARDELGMLAPGVDPPTYKVEGRVDRALVEVRRLRLLLTEQSDLAALDGPAQFPELLLEPVLTLRDRVPEDHLVDGDACDLASGE